MSKILLIFLVKQIIFILFIFSIKNFIKLIKEYKIKLNIKY